VSEVSIAGQRLSLPISRSQQPHCSLSPLIAAEQVTITPTPFRQSKAVFVLGLPDPAIKVIFELSCGHCLILSAFIF